MIDEPSPKQMEAILTELAKQGIDGDNLDDQDSSPTSPGPDPKRRYWVLWSHERLTFLQNLLDQGKTEEEIAQVLSMMEKQVRIGMRRLRRRAE
jgi:hypothetical protein